VNAPASWLAVMLGAIALLASACQAQTPPAEAESFVDEMAAFGPVMTCIDHAPPQDTAAAEACLTNGGVALADLRQELGDPPRPVDILPVAAMFMRKPGVQFTPEVEKRALRYARCIEAGAL
tara:strand:- start:492 stop:857 length:366 start_codon:yes stop_codon:yes gene_type:complete